MKFFAIIFLFTLAGCTTTAERMGDLKKRAAFEFDCEESKLSTQMLKEITDMGRLMNGTTVGVSGCGKKAVYILDRTWIMNTAKDK
jgi:hypothetical protein